MNPVNPLAQNSASDRLFGPLAIVTAIVLGSAVAIAFGLTSVWVIFLILRAESEEIASEVTHLPIYCLTFLLLSGVAGSAMYSLMKQKPWANRAQLAMWAITVGITLWFTLLRR